MMKKIISFPTGRTQSLRQAFTNQQGFALVISLGLTALIMVFALGVSSKMRHSLRTASDIESSTEAYYAAEAALEMGLFENKDKEAGYEAKVTCDETGNCVDQLGNSTTKGINYVDRNGAYASWKIQGKAGCEHASELNTECDTNSSNYYVPTPGSGTAGADCDPLRGYPEVDNPCNWNKIHVGEIATIPLYADDEAGGINNPTDLGIISMNVKVRTPCEDGSMECEGVNRHVLMNSDEDGNGDPDYDTIIAWEIVGTDKTDYLQPNTDRDPFTSAPKLLNTEIHNDRINIASSTDFTILNQDSNGYLPGKITKTVNDYIMNTDKPTLTLYVVHSLTNINGNSIPYLEYQVEYITNNSPPADVYQTIIAEGYSGNFKQSVEIKQGQKTGILKFVIQN